MKNKKGFVFVETIVVIVVLLTSLLYLYSTFIALSNNEKKRITYDDVSYLYKTYSLKKYFVSQRLDRIVSQLDSSNGNYIVSFGCGSRDLFDDYKKEGAFCELIHEELNVSNIYMTYYDLSALQECGNQVDGICSIFSNVSKELGAYLKTLGGSDATESEYRMIIEYQMDHFGNACTDGEYCNHYFATIKVGDDL